MTDYDAASPPDPLLWLAMSPADRLRVVVAFHAAHRIASAPYKSHAALHVVVEDLLARGDGPMVRAVARLRQQGLSRHEALHAVGRLWADHLRQQGQAAAPADAAWQRRLNDALERLSADPPAAD